MYKTKKKGQVRHAINEEIERKLRKRERRGTLEWAQIPMQGATQKSRQPALI